MLVKSLLELIGTTTSSLEALLQLRKEMLIWFYGYSNADLTGLQLSKIVKGKPILFYDRYPQFAAKL
jgi:hypothetical protein